MWADCQVSLCHVNSFGTRNQNSKIAQFYFDESYPKKIMKPDVFENADHDKSVHFTRKVREIVTNPGRLCIGNLQNELKT